MKYLLLALLVLFPSVTFAVSTPRDFKDFVNVIMGINQLLVSVIFTLTFLVIAWAVIEAWIINGGDEESVKDGRRTLTIGVVVLVIMSSIWGILAVLRAGLF